MRRRQPDPFRRTREHRSATGAKALQEERYALRAPRGDERPDRRGPATSHWRRGRRRWTGYAPRASRGRGHEASADADRLRAVLGERRLLAHQEHRAAAAAHEPEVDAAMAQAIGEWRRVGHGRITRGTRRCPRRVGTWSGFIAASRAARDVTRGTLRWQTSVAASTESIPRGPRHVRRGLSSECRGGGPARPGARVQRRG